MLIQGRMLKKIIKEEISRTVIKEESAIDLAVAKSKATSLASDADKSSDANVVPMVEFFADILAGNKIVTANRNTPEDNLYVNQALGAFEKMRGIEGRLTSFPPSTYPEEGVQDLQKMCSIQSDGDFGRQTLAAAVTNGRAKIDPTLMRSPERRRSAAKLIAKMVKSPTSINADDLVDNLSGAADLGSDIGVARSAKITKDDFIVAVSTTEVGELMSDELGMTVEDIKRKAKQIPDSDSMTVEEWIKYIGGGIAGVSFDPNQLEAIASAVASVSGKQDRSDIGVARSSSVKNSSAEQNLIVRPLQAGTASLKESRDLTARLMDLWLK